MGMAGLAAGVDGAAGAAPKANTPLLLPDDPNPLELPNWNPPSNKGNTNIHLSKQTNKTLNLGAFLA